MSKSFYNWRLKHLMDKVDLIKRNCVEIINEDKITKFMKKGVVYCGIGICTGIINMDGGNIERWVWKWDAGAESFTEKQKGEASDSFKRAGFNWGICRELYDYPIIQVKLKADEFELKDGRAKQTWNLKLKSWIWFTQFTEDTLSYLACKDQNGNTRFIYGEYIKPLID